MRALVLKAFNEMAVEEVPAPAPGRDEVLVQTVATGICGSDIHGFTGENGRRVPGQVMGHETAGRIAALGEDVSGFVEGDAVTYNPLVVPAASAAEFRGRELHAPEKFVIGVRQDRSAAFGELVAVPARNLVRVPDGFPLELAALVEPLAVGLHAVRRASAVAGLPTLVVGAGPIGQSVVLALAAEGGGKVVVSEPSAGRRAVAEALGAVTIDPAAGPAVPEAVAAALGGPAHVAFDAVGSSSTVADALASVGPGGEVCLVGMAAPRLDVAAYDVSTAERTLVGSFAYTSVDFADAAQWAFAHRAELEPLVSRQVPLEQAPQAFADLARPDGTPGKVLVRFDR